MTTAQVDLLAPWELRARIHDVVDVYREAFAQPPNNESETDVEEFAGRFPPHLTRLGFRFAAATDAAGELVGFAYGHTGGSEYWWYRTVTAALDQETIDRWLSDYFEVLEVAVRPGWQGRGIGARAFDALLEGLPHRTVALSTLDAPSPARTMYERRGFVPILSGFRFGPGEPEFTVMARDLPR